MIHVLYTLTDVRGTYSKFIGTSLASLFRHTHEQVTAHLFHDGSLSEANRLRFLQLAGEYGQQVRFYNVRARLPKTCAAAEQIFAQAMDKNARYPEAAMYRLLAPVLLPRDVHRLIYLDADTIVLLDIAELWQEKLGTNGMGAVREDTLLTHYQAKSGKGELQEPVYRRMNGLDLSNCFNSGVLLMDLDRLRQQENRLLPGLRFLARYPGESKFYDQDILNYYYAKDLTPLPWRYNILVHWDRQYARSTFTAGIYHFMGHTLGFDESDARDTAFYDEFLRTPWGGGKFVCKVFQTERAILTNDFWTWMRQAQRLIKALATGRQLVLAATEERREQVEKWREEQGRTAPLISFGSEEHLVLSLPYDVQQTVYALFACDYQKVAAPLLASGLKSGEHFVDGSFLLCGEKWLRHRIEPNLFFSVL